MTEPLDVSNFKYDLTSIGKYCDSIQLDNESRAQINSVFQKCDKYDAEGKKVKGGDGELNEKEQAKFKKYLQRKFPDLCHKLSEFFIMMDIIQDKKAEEAKARADELLRNDIKKENRSPVLDEDVE